MENKQFFDPYNFNNMIMQPTTTQNTMSENNFVPNLQPDPAMIYQQQFWYYSYLTKMLEYKIKLKEYECMNKKQS